MGREVYSLRPRNNAPSSLSAESDGTEWTWTLLRSIKVRSGDDDSSLSFTHQLTPHCHTKAFYLSGIQI